MRYSLALLAGTTLVITGCQPETTAPALVPPTAPLFGKNTATNATSVWKLPIQAAGLGLVSDGRQSDGIYSTYEDGVCGVTGKIFTTGSGDATIQTNNPRAKNTTCQTARTMTAVYSVGDPVYPDGGTETMLVFVNLRNISNATTTIGVGHLNRVQRILSLNPTQTERCDAWRWSDEGVAGDKVWVERVNTTTYHVYTKDRDPDPVAAEASAGLNRAVCTTTGQWHNLSVDLYVVSKQALL